MPTPDTAAGLWRCGMVALLATLLNSLLIYLVTSTTRFGKPSLLRCLLASSACSAVLLLGFGLSAFIALRGCPYAGAIVIIPGVLASFLLTLPVQGWILGLPNRAAVRVWVIYAVGTPLILVWVVIGFLWAGLL